MRKHKHSSPKSSRRGADDGGRLWLYGTHAVLAALANPERVCERALVSDDDDAELAVAAVEIGGHGTVIDRVSRDDVTAVLPQGAVHQGIALLARPLEDHGIEDAMDRALQSDTPCILLLDQVTDPQNVGAILRSAAAFGAAADAAPGGTATASAVTDDASADATATLGYCRASSTADGATPVDDHLDGEAGTSGADFNFSTLAIVSGATISLTSWTVTQPES